MKDGSGKVTLLEVWVRLSLIISPLIGPYILGASKEGRVIIPIL